MADSTDDAETGDQEVGGTRSPLSVAEFADRYDEWAGDYDAENDARVVRACAALVVKHAMPTSEDVVLDMGTGTGTVALALAEDAETVVGRDISAGMLHRAREKAAARGYDNVEFGVGRLRNPNVDGADIVVTNLVLHHLDNAAKRTAIETLADLGPKRLVFGEAMYFEDRDPADPLFKPETVYPATVGYLVDVITDAGYAVTHIDRVHDEAGVLVCERR